MKYYCGERKIWQTGNSKVITLPKDLSRGIERVEVLFDKENQEFILKVVDEVKKNN